MTGAGGKHMICYDRRRHGLIDRGAEGSPWACCKEMVISAQEVKGGTGAIALHIPKTGRVNIESYQILSLAKLL